MSARSPPPCWALFFSIPGNSLGSRPWREFFSWSALSRPYSFGDATVSVKHNLHYFRVNYSTVVFIVLLSSFIFHSSFMFVFLIIRIAWLYLYFVFNRAIDDRLVLALLSLVTIVALLLCGVWLNVLVSVLIGGFLVLLHAAVRGREDLYLNELEGSEGRLFSVVGSSMN